MKNDHKIKNASQLASQVQKLREIRRKQITRLRPNRQRRQSLRKSQRNEIFLKTRGRCHICGGEILEDETWQADHVISYARGGMHSIDNYLPAHVLCNNYRWSYLSEEFQWILKLGVWMRTLIENEDIKAMELAERFVKHEIHRRSRQKGDK